jgi:hypothetical protein
MCLKHGSHVISVENRCKMGLYIDFLIWNGQVSIHEKLLNDSVTSVCPIYCF